MAKEVLRIAWPMLVAQVAESIYSLIDTLFVSRLGSRALAAVALGSYATWLLFVVVALVSTGTMVVVSQAYGAGRIDEIGRIVGTALILALLISAPLAFVSYVASYKLMLLLSGEPDLAKLAAKYFGIRGLGIVASCLAMCTDSSLRALGATRQSMVATVSSAAINLALDPLLIFGLLGFPRMGVEGAALATVTSIAYMIPLELVYLAKLGIVVKPSMSLSLAKRVIVVGGPTALERLVFSIGNNVYVATISRCGSEALAAHQVGLRIESFVYMPGFAFSVAAAALVGQRVGANDVANAKKLGLEAAKIATIILSISGALLALLAPLIVEPFAPNAEVQRLATTYLILAGLSEPGLALAMVLSYAIRGSGNTVVPLIVNALGLYTLRVAPSMFLTRVWGVVGAWIAMFVDVYVRGITFLILYTRRFEHIARRVV